MESIYIQTIPPPSIGGMGMIKMNKDDLILHRGGKDVNVDEKVLLERVYPSDKVEVMRGYVQLRYMAPIPIDEYGCDYAVVEAARVSYGNGIRNIESDRKLISFLRKNHHTSPFEHVIFSFTISCPLFVARHIMRHRTFSYNEISARYTECEDVMYVPPNLRRPSKVNKQSSEMEDLDPTICEEIDRHNQRSYELYKSLLSKGLSREQARVVLPIGIYTCFVMTGNLKNWMHFLYLTDSDDTQYETRLYAKAISSIIRKYCPLSMSE
jgi:thymidylate synthase (FAD)